MTVFVDLSAPGLATDGVLALIRKQAANPGDSEVLFKVSKPVFARFAKKQPKGVNVSSKEATIIGRFAGVSSRNYVLSGHHECTNCGRVLTFYDVFQSGRKFHGDNYIRRFVGARDQYHIQIHRKNPVLPVECTECHTVNRLENGCYQCSGYTYA